jgi:hypothetical protein
MLHAQVSAWVGAFSGILAGGVIGFFLGRRLREQGARRRFWAASGVSLAIGMSVIFIGELVGVDFLTGAGVGLMTGGLNGLRWGMGRLSDAPRPNREPVVPGEIERRGGLPAEPPREQPAPEEPREPGRAETPVREGDREHTPVG